MVIFLLNKCPLRLKLSINMILVCWINCLSTLYVWSMQSSMRYLISSFCQQILVWKEKKLSKLFKQSEAPLNHSSHPRQTKQLHQAMSLEVKMPMTSCYRSSHMEALSLSVSNLMICWEEGYQQEKSQSSVEHQGLEKHRQGTKE